MITQVITEKQANKADYCFGDQNILANEFKKGLLNLRRSLDRNPKDNTNLTKNFEENALECSLILKEIQLFSALYAIQIGE